MRTSFLILAVLGQGWWNYCFETPGSPHHHPSSPSYSTPHHHKFLLAVSRRRKVIIKKMSNCDFCGSCKAYPMSFKEAECIIVMPPILWIPQSFPDSLDRFREDTWNLTNIFVNIQKQKVINESTQQRIDWSSLISSALSILLKNRLMISSFCPKNVYRSINVSLTCTFNFFTVVSYSQCFGTALPTPLFLTGEGVSTWMSVEILEREKFFVLFFWVLLLCYLAPVVCKVIRLKIEGKIW